MSKNKKIDDQDLFTACKMALQWINNIIDAYGEEPIIDLMPNNWGGRIQIQEALQNHCEHHPQSIYSWSVDNVHCAACCDCGEVLAGGVDLENVPEEGVSNG